MNLNNDAKTYLDIFKEHYPNFIFKEFYGNYCPAGFFKYGMDNIHIFSIIALAFLKTCCLQECLYFLLKFSFPFGQ